MTTDFRTPHNLFLGPGNYVLLFGSGLFGASGLGYMSSGNPPLAEFWGLSASPNWISGYGGNSYRFVIEGVAVGVPEPGSLALLGLGLAGLVGMRRRRR